MMESAPLFLRKSLCVVLLAFVLGVFFHTPCRADVNPADGERLKAIFHEILEKQTDAAETRGYDLDISGDILVEPAGDYFAVTMPHLTMVYDGGSRANIGIILINAQPGNIEDEWEMTLSVPTPITRYDEKNKKLASVLIGKQSFAGIWHERFRNFIKLNARYKDVTIKDIQSGSVMTIPDTHIVYDLKEDENGLWSGPSRFDFSDIEFNVKGSKAISRIDRVSLSANLYDYSFEAAAAYDETIEALQESYSGSDAGGVSTPHVMGIYNMITGFMGEAWDGFTFDISVEGVHLIRPSLPDSSKEERLHVDKSFMGFGMTGFREGDVKLGWKMGYDGLRFEPRDQDATDTFPSHSNIDIDINNLPYKAIVELGRTTLQSTAQAPQMAQMAGLQAMMMVPKLVTEAGTNLTLKDVSVGNDIYNVLLNGVMTADLNAVKGFVGSSRAEIKGLSDLIEVINRNLEKPDIEEATRSKLQKSLSVLSVLQMVGQQETDAEGNAIRAYDMDLTKDGKTLLNGTDMGTLISGAGGSEDSVQ